MINSIQKPIFLAAVTIVFAGTLFWNGKTNVKDGLVSAAEARIGRPLTPMSYAGVARRTTRRAVYGTAAATAAAGAYVATRPGCVQVTNAYGQVVTRC